MHWLYYYYLDRYSYSFKSWFAGLHREVFNLIDKPPRKKRNETIEAYVLRIEKRHALRELDRNIMVTRVFNLNGVEAELQTNLPPSRKRLFEIMKSQTEQYYLYQYLREQIKRTKG